MQELQNIYASDGTLLRARVSTAAAMVFLRKHAGPRAFFTVGEGRINVHRGEPRRPYTRKTAVAYAERDGEGVVS